MKIKLNLSEAHFIKTTLETILESEGETKNKFIIKDILNKLKK